MKNEGSFKNVKLLTIKKHNQGYIIKADKQEINVERATNFEWRMDEPVSINHMYFGTGSGRYEDMGFNIEFSEPCTIDVSNPDARCYMYIKKL